MDASFLSIHRILMFNFSIFVPFHPIHAFQSNNQLLSPHLPIILYTNTIPYTIYTTLASWPCPCPCMHESPAVTQCVTSIRNDTITNHIYTTIIYTIAILIICSCRVTIHSFLNPPCDHFTPQHHGYVVLRVVLCCVLQ